MRNDFHRSKINYLMRNNFHRSKINYLMRNDFHRSKITSPKDLWGSMNMRDGNVCERMMEEVGHRDSLGS